MHSYTEFFPVRGTDDQLDIAGLLFQGLLSGDQREILSFDDSIWTASRLRNRVIAMQQLLHARGLVQGDRVAVMLENHPDHMALIYALMLSGLVWVPVNTKLKSSGIDYLLGHCKPAIIIHEPHFAAEVGSACAEHAHIQALSASELVAAGTEPNSQLSRAQLEHDSVLCIIYTSGTTGAPKGVLFTHRMMRLAAEAVLRVADVRDGDRLFLWEPLCHIGGAQMLLLPFMQNVSLVTVPRFSASRFWKQVCEGRCTQLHYLGGILDILMRLPPEQQPATHPLRVAWGAGVGLSQWHAVQQRLGIPLRECYGMTEGSSFATVNTMNVPGSIGTPFPWLSIELLDNNDRPVPLGEIGQIVVSSCIPGTFLAGYLDNPKATSEALRDGRLYTGDMARKDADGNLYFVGRRTDSMRIRGENVSAWEVERAVLGYPGVAAAAAVGVASSIGEQEILVYVKWEDGGRGRFDALSDWLGTRLASFQLPRYFKSIDAFELTPSERIRKHLLDKRVDDAWDRRETHPSE